MFFADYEIQNIRATLVPCLCVPKLSAKLPEAFSDA